MILFGSNLSTQPEAQNINQETKEVDKPFRAYTTSTKRYERYDLLDEDNELQSRREVKEQREKLSDIRERLLNLLSNLYGLYEDTEDELRVSKTLAEMESIEEAFSNIHGKAQDYQNSHSDVMWGDESVTSNWDTHSASKNLEKVELETKRYKNA